MSFANANDITECKNFEPPIIQDHKFKEEEKEEPNIPGQKQIEELYAFLSETELSKQAQKMLSPLIDLFEACGSYEEAYALLTDKNLKSKQFEQSLQKALFLAELQGRGDGLDK